MLNATFDDFRYQVIPEPSAGLSMAIGLAGIVGIRRDRKRGPCKV